MFSKQKTKITYVIIALIGLIVLWYIFKPKTNFDSCYEKCMKTSWESKTNRELMDKVISEKSNEAIDQLINESLKEEPKENTCIRVCVNTK